MRRIKTVLGVVAVMAAMSVVFAAPAMADDLDFDGLDDGFFVIVDCDDFFFDHCNNNADDFCDDDFFFNHCGFDRFGFNDGFGDFEQEAESGDINQSFDVSQAGDNSNQTVGIQGVANTGNAQNQIGVIDAGNGFVDFDGNNDDERFFFVGDDFCDFGDFDGDGVCDRLDRLEERFEDRCEDGDNDGFCDRLEDRIDRLEDRIDDDGFFFIVDDFDGDGFSDSGSDFEFEDVGASIEVSPTNTVTSDQQVNQAATAFGK